MRGFNRRLIDNDQLIGLIELLLITGGLMKLRLQLLVSDLAQRAFDKLRGFPALRACKTFGLDLGLTVRRDRDFDRLQAAPPT